MFHFNVVNEIPTEDSYSWKLLDNVMNEVIQNKHFSNTVNIFFILTYESPERNVIVPRGFELGVKDIHGNTSQYICFFSCIKRHK